MAKKESSINIEKIKTGIIILLSLVIVFGVAFVVPELKNCGSCKEVLPDITSITMEDFRKIIKEDEVSLIYIASPTCGHCINQKPIMQQLVRDYGVTVNYLNVTKLGQKDYDELYDFYVSIQIDKYEQDGILTPTILLVKNEKVLEVNLGEIGLDNLVKMLNKYVKVEKE